MKKWEVKKEKKEALLTSSVCPLLSNPTSQSSPLEMVSILNRHFMLDVNRVSV